MKGKPRVRVRIVPMGACEVDISLSRRDVAEYLDCAPGAERNRWIEDHIDQRVDALDVEPDYWDVTDWWLLDVPGDVPDVDRVFVDDGQRTIFEEIGLGEGEGDGNDR